MTRSSPSDLRRMLAGMEFGNAFTELNDPVDQLAPHGRGSSQLPVANHHARSTATFCWRSSTACRRPAGLGSELIVSSWC